MASTFVAFSPEVAQRPLTRPGGATARTNPVTSAPEGNAVRPSTITALVSSAATASSTSLVSDATGVDYQEDVCAGRSGHGLVRAAPEPWAPGSN